jgi:cytochrome c biogenesis protein CcdA
MSILTAFISGLLAAFTPCVIVLIPALVYRFSHQEKKPLRSFVLFTISFLLVYLISALFLAELFTSTIRYGLQLGLGLLFVIFGVLALLNRFNPLQFQLIKNPLLFGLVFALIVSVNPCVFAYLGVLLSTTSSTLLLPSMLFFALGLLLPSIVFATFGKTLLFKVKQASKLMHRVSQGMNALLIIMGIYMIYTIKMLGQTDILITGILLLITFLIILRSFFFLQGPKHFKQLEHIALFVALFLIMVSAVFHCSAHIHKNTQKDLDTSNPFLIDNLQNPSFQETQPTCNAQVNDCDVCRRCIIIFAAGAILGFGTIVLTHHIITKKKFRLKRL